MDKETDEIEPAGLSKSECSEMAGSRVDGGPASLECTMTQIIKLEGETNYAVCGKVVGVHMRDDCIVNGIFDVMTFNPLSRMGYRDYTVVREKFELKRPGE